LLFIGLQFLPSLWDVRSFIPRCLFLYALSSSRFISLMIPWAGPPGSPTNEPLRSSTRALASQYHLLPALTDTRRCVFHAGLVRPEEHVSGMPDSLFVFSRFDTRKISFFFFIGSQSGGLCGFLVCVSSRDSHLYKARAETSLLEDEQPLGPFLVEIAGSRPRFSSRCFAPDLENGCSTIAPPLTNLWGAFSSCYPLLLAALTPPPRIPLVQL